MGRFLTFYQSTIGKKAVAAVTGLIMAGFLVGHASGNLKVFLPNPEPHVPDIDAYAEALRTIGEPLLPRGAVLWVARAVLLVALVLHVHCVIQLALKSRAARPTEYEGRRFLSATLPARLMLVGGVLLFAFVVFHILHFTTGTIDAANFEHGAVYENLYAAFTRWPFVVIYLVAMAVVAFHLYHGAWSAFQSLGLDNPDRNRSLRLAAALLSLALFAGFAAVPASFLTGALPTPVEKVAAPHPAPAERASR